MNVNLHIMTHSLIAVVQDNSAIGTIPFSFVVPAEDPRYSQILKVLSDGFDGIKITNILRFQDTTDESKSDKIPKEQVTHERRARERVKEKERIEVKPEEDKLLIDKIEMPSGLKKQFVELQRRHKPRSYLLKFWDKLQKNPNQESIKMLYHFLEHNGHPIMADGNFIAYKAVTMDCKDHHTKTNEHKVGKIIRMAREKVDSNPNETCSTGLHVCSFKYTENFYKGCSRYFEVLVDPKDVVCVPNDYNGTKMRVAAYKVYREIKEDRKEKSRATQIGILKKLAKKSKHEMFANIKWKKR